MRVNILLKYSLYCGAVYFLLMSTAHSIGLKVPLLFIYFNVPSYAYQDKIIALLTFGWSIFFFIAGRTLLRPLIIGILISGFAAIAMLTFINVSTDFSFFGNDISTGSFHAMTISLCVYWAVLLISFLSVAKQDFSPETSPHKKSEC